jgi:signal transduction histidine kinase
MTKGSSRQTLLRLLERDRAEMAAMLRGETAQALTMVLVSLASLENCNDAAEVQQGIRELRESVRAELTRIHTIASRLGPSALADFGLQPALTESVRTLALAQGPEIIIDLADASNGVREDERALLFRILEEALRNALTHADARNVTVKAIAEGGGMEYAVDDDGRGFDVDDLDSENATSGLAAMHVRASAIGGRLEVNSTRGSGTSIRLKLPRREY